MRTGWLYLRHQRSINNFASALVIQRQTRQKLTTAFLAVSYVGHCSHSEE